MNIQLDINNFCFLSEVKMEKTMEMKKEYVVPFMEILELKSQTNLLDGSGEDPETLEDGELN